MTTKQLAARLQAIEDRQEALDALHKEQSRNSETGFWMPDGPRPGRQNRFVWQGFIADLSQEQFLMVHTLWQDAEHRADSVTLAYAIYKDEERASGRSLEQLAGKINAAFKRAGMTWRVTKEGCEFWLV